MKVERANVAPWVPNRGRDHLLRVKGEETRKTHPILRVEFSHVEFLLGKRNIPRQSSYFTMLGRVRACWVQVVFCFCSLSILVTLRYEYWYGALYPKDGIIPNQFSLNMSARSDESGAARLAYLELLKRALIGATALFSNVQLIDCPRGFGKKLNPRDSGVLINGGYERLINMHSLLDKVRLEHIKGDYVECGVWRGGSALFMAAYAKLYGQVDRKTWLFDSFEGVPPGNSSERWRNNNGELIDRGWEKDNLAVALEDVQRHFSQYDLAGPSIIFVKGWFSKTLPVSQVESIAILRVDGDLYSSTYLVLKHLYHRISIGGGVILDDWGIPGARKAVEAFREEHGITEEIQMHDPPGCYPVAHWRKIRPTQHVVREQV